MPRKTSPALPALLLAALGLARCIVYQDFYTDHHTTGSGSTTGTGDAGGCTPGEAADCYDGPQGTEGVGVCKHGTKTCAADGMNWGPCEGEVTPKPENCATSEDEDCDGKAPPCSCNFLWNKRFGDDTASKTTFARGVAVDASGNIIVAGYFLGSVDFGGGTLVNQGGFDIFVAKLGPSGEHLWSRSFGGAGDQAATGVAVDPSGNVIVTGYFWNVLDLGAPNTLVSQGNNDIFVMKLDAASGGHLWSKGFGDPTVQGGLGVAADASGNVLLTGYFGGAVSFGGAPVVGHGGTDVFVAKLDPSGAHLWSKGFGDADGQEGTGVAVDASGNIALTGYFASTVDFGGGALMSAPSVPSAYVAKLDPSGAHLWSRTAGAISPGSDSYGVGVAAGASGNVIAGGKFVGTMDFGDGPLVCQGSQAVFVVDHDTSGGHPWSRAFGGASSDASTAASGVAVDTFGNLLVAGSFSGSINFGGGPLASSSGSTSDVFLAKFDGSDKHHICSQRFGMTGSNSAAGVAVDAASNVVVVGTFSEAIDFGGGPLMAGTGSDVFVAKFTP
jgi:hypothetical protein